MKPKRHVLHVSQLEDAEAEEVGPLLRETSSVIAQLTSPDQVYVCLWSHMGGMPGHIHFVVQPVTRDIMDAFGVYGPGLQVAMFDAGEMPPADEVEAFAERARRAFTAV